MGSAHGGASTGMAPAHRGDRPRVVAITTGMAVTACVGAMTTIVARGGQGERGGDNGTHDAVAGDHDAW
ncbi:hypothetical protein B296_00017371 [Ensete ventricosum]|uniref:Uncharacterized protein n=1 Tax=Ensete ventricosum TaxID=4639 RepID=A0A427ATL1_ENSVE|nr:hypothetical protein B296_00017371 [Ensete ventricosum]